jgi:hypothetical protein
MGYAAGDGSRMGIVIEVQQGMVNRGACIKWLSQYPHEEETLFGPLTGLEVRGTRIDGSVVVIECALSIKSGLRGCEPLERSQPKTCFACTCRLAAC